jgi:hypothetical protein
MDNLFHALNNMRKSVNSAMEKLKKRRGCDHIVRAD